jgi:uncharacterized membrane protein
MGGEHAVDISLRMKRITTTIVVVLGVMILAGMLAIGFGTKARPELEGVLAGPVYDAEVTRTRIEACAGTTPRDNVYCHVVTIRLTQGPHRGEHRELEFSVTGNAAVLDRGDRIVVSQVTGAPPGQDYQYADRQRRTPLVFLTIVFVLAVVALARWRGALALAGLAISLIVILTFIVPAILDGYDPLLVSVLGSAAIAYVALYLAHGFNSLATVALLGTLASLALIIGLSQVFTALADFSGVVGEDASVLRVLAGDIDVTGLLLGGIVIGALGALDDVTVTQASAVAELATSNPSHSRIQVYRSAVRVGRDHIASAVNTLALAYAGAALPTVLLFVLSRQSLGTVANSEVVAVEIVRTLVGSIGLVAAVPLTTWLAATVVTRPRRDHPPAADAEPEAIDPNRPFWS